jgi:hypothetical protein
MIAVVGTATTLSPVSSSADDLFEHP